MLLQLTKIKKNMKNQAFKMLIKFSNIQAINLNFYNSLIELIKRSEKKNILFKIEYNQQVMSNEGTAENYYNARWCALR